MIENIRRSIATEEFDYQTLMNALKSYVRPRNKVTALLRQGQLVRVKKGIYVFGKGYERRPFSREVLANMVYGPSYVSLDTALHYYGLIPERVEAVTSLTTGRSRRFQTSVGLFIYQRAPLKAYSLGLRRIELTDPGAAWPDAGRAIDRPPAFLMASPEKALADKVYHDRGTGIRSLADARDYLLAHLRIDPDGLREMDAGFLLEVARSYRSQKIQLISRLVEKLKREGKTL